MPEFFFFLLVFLRLFQLMKKFFNFYVWLFFFQPIKKQCCPRAENRTFSKTWVRGGQGQGLEFGGRRPQNVFSRPTTNVSINKSTVIGFSTVCHSDSH